MTQKRPCVYNLANRRNGTLYIGVTSDQNYEVHRLVFVEFHNTMEAAIFRGVSSLGPLAGRGMG